MSTGPDFGESRDAWLKSGRSGGGESAASCPNPNPSRRCLNLKDAFDGLLERFLVDYEKSVMT